MHQERRTRRSSYRGPALDLYLTSVARRAGLSSLVLADTHGLLVACSNTTRNADELAATGATMVARWRTAAAVPDRGMLVQSRPFGGGQLYLCAVGEASASARDVGEAWSGVERILHER